MQTILYHEDSETEQKETREKEREREEISGMDQLLIFHRDSMTGTNMKNNILYKFLWTSRPDQNPENIVSYNNTGDGAITISNFRTLL